jgi:hypothetical protein
VNPGQLAKSPMIFATLFRISLGDETGKLLIFPLAGDPLTTTKWIGCGSSGGTLS